ncbi:phosphoacetylglucosamine mutase-like [Portunus trituberculatus]|uniref:phosphoacetylglucosamine mutase-like n=1 Tax=Portunus trituberculatus TaxID=210409 RepID=UPI001E1D10E3|nr:phosphoacetylglucosamine mutase-like [Portunus trituberculatus]
MESGKMFAEAVRLAKESHPKTTTKTVKYGTAGFRTKAEELDFVMYRMGILAAMRSRDTRAAIGVMITASHNPVPDNGVKLVDPQGEMLAPAWEAHATTLVNATDDGIAAALEAITSAAKINTGNAALVIVGRDTRPSSNGLRDAVLAGVAAVGGEVKDLGVVSTPVLHYMVTCHNDGGEYGEPTIEGYYKKISQAFVSLRSGGACNGNYEPVILFDGANGVGALAMEEFTKHLQDALKVTMYNKGEGVLNHLCGADYVKVQQKWPEGVPKTQNVRCVSVDGDADRVMYSFVDGSGQYYMLDGDKIATLVAGYLKELVAGSGLKLNLGLVQTAYANGASTAYITDKLGVPVACVKTGVKHLHHAAQDFDIGVYFEANGHGTVIVSSSARQAIKEAAKAKNAQAEKLAQVLDVINESVGDAISDMFLVETVLHARGWSALDWNAAYTDLPNRQMKVMVADRAVITTTDAERVCVTPAGLQDTINKIVANFPKGRSFVRPSGTEDVVRVYAEASTQENTDSLAVQVACAVYEQAGGVGDRPKPPC